MACKKCPQKQVYNKELASLSQTEFETLVSTNGDGMILKYEGPNQQQIPIKGPYTGQRYRTKVRADGSYLFNVHPEDANLLMQRTRKGKALFTEHVQPVAVERKPEVIKTAAPKLPENEPVMDVWDDIPNENEPLQFESEQKPDFPLTFDTVSEFRDYMTDNEPSEDELANMLVAEKTGKNRKTITSELERLLNG